MAEGDIGAVIDTGIFNAALANEPDIMHVSGDVFTIAYKGPLNHGWLCTLTIDNLGNVGPVLDTLEFDNVNGSTPYLIYISGNIYAIAYWNTTSSDGIVKTVPIDAAGNIGAVIDTFVFDAAQGWVPAIIHVSGNVFAIAYRGPGDDGWLCTITIDNAGNIGGAVIDTLEFDATYCSLPQIIHISGDVFAIDYTAAGAGGNEICTMDIDNAGNIGAVIGRYEWPAPPSTHDEAKIVHIAGNIYAVASEDITNHGWVTTQFINNDGTICPFPPCLYIDSLEFDGVNGTRPDIIHVGTGDVYAVAYEGPDNDGWLCTFHITAAGIISAIIDTLEFDDVSASYPDIVHVYRNIYAIAYGHAGPGWVRTVDIETAVSPTVQTDPATGVT